jgi:hypothetical protein
VELTRFEGPWSVQDASYLIDELLSGDGFGEDMECFKLVAVIQAVIIDEASDHEDRDSGAFGAEIDGGVVAGHAVDVGADDQEVRPEVFEAVDGTAQAAFGDDEIAFACEEVLHDISNIRIRGEQEDGFVCWSHSTPAKYILQNVIYYGTSERFRLQ